MATFSELANLSADVVAKVEDSKEARPAMANATVFRSQLLARHGEGGRAGSFEMLTVLGIQEDI